MSTPSPEAELQAANVTNEHVVNLTKELPDATRQAIVAFVGYAATALGAYVGGEAVIDDDPKSSTVLGVREQRDELKLENLQLEVANARLRYRAEDNKFDNKVDALPEACYTRLERYLAPDGDLQGLSNGEAVRYLFKANQRSRNVCGNEENTRARVEKIRGANDLVQARAAEIPEKKEAVEAEKIRQATDKSGEDFWSDPEIWLALLAALGIGGGAAGVRLTRTMRKNSKVVEETLVGIAGQGKRDEVRKLMKRDSRLPNPKRNLGLWSAEV